MYLRYIDLFKMSDAMHWSVSARENKYRCLRIICYNKIPHEIHTGKYCLKEKKRKENKRKGITRVSEDVDKLGSLWLAHKNVGCHRTMESV